MDQLNHTGYKVTIDLSTQLDTNDLDFLNLFLESKKQSGGGDILKTELINPSQLVIYYEDIEAQQRVLKKKYLQFKNYELKATLNGFINELYQLEPNQLIIYNIKSNEDQFYIKLYAENLFATKNQVIQIHKSKIFSNTVLINYRDPIDRDLLAERFPKCSLYKNDQLTIMDSFKTNTYIIKSDLNQLKREIERKLNEPFFLAEFKSYCLYQSDSIKDLTHLISDYLTSNKLICEYCYNLNLFNLPLIELKTNDKIIQTDLMVAMATDNDIILELNSSDLYVDALINAKQLFVNFDDLLKKLDTNLTMKLNQQTKTIQIRNVTNEPQWKQKVSNELKKYFTSKAMFKQIKIPQEIQMNHLEQLQLKLSKINKECPALFFRLATNEINCYGTKNALINKLETLPDLFKSIIKNETKQDEPLMPFYDLDPNSLIFKLFSNIPQLFYDFKNILKEHQADLIKETLNNSFIIQIICLKLNDLDSQQWCHKIKLLTEEHERNRLRLKKIQIPLNLKRQKELDDLKKHLDHFYSKEKTIKYELKSNEYITVYGYATQVKSFNDNIQSKFSNLENNIKDRIRRKLEVKLESNRVPLIIFNNNNLFREFNNQLSKLEANADLAPNKSIKIKCLMSQTKAQNEQTVEQWRTKIDSFILNYFSQIITKKIKCNKNTDLTNKQVHITWLDQDQCEITGLKEDVNRFESDLALPKLMDLAMDLEPINIKELKEEETFLISDLKWFQTRMLFEKKYFLFITETYKELSVLVDTQLTRIFYTGKKKDIDEAKKLAFDILDQILGTEMESNLALNEKLIDNEQKLNALIKTTGLCCIIDAKTNADKYTIYATTYEDIERCRTLLSGINF